MSRGRGSATDDILYGQVGPRSSSEGHRLDDLLAQFQARLRVDGRARRLSSIPDDFFPFLSEGFPEDPRINEMIQHVADWIRADSMTMDTIQAAYQLLAWGPATIFGKQPDGSDMSDRYQALVRKCLSHNLAYVNPEREALDQRITELMTARDLKPLVTPRLAAMPDGPKHYISKTDETKTCCGVFINTESWHWQTDLTRVPSRGAASSSEKAGQFCHRCARGRAKKAAMTPLSEAEISYHAANTASDQVPDKVIEVLSDRERRSPLDIQHLVEQQVWSAAVRSIPLEEPLSDHDLDYLASLEPGDVII